MRPLQMPILTILTNICERWGSGVKLQGGGVSLAEHEIGFKLTTQSQQLVLWQQQESWRQRTLLCGG